MSDDYTIDPFKPQQPSIPGLTPGTAKAAKLSPPAPAVYSPDIPLEKAPPSPMLWVALSVVGTLLVLCSGFFYWMKGSPAKATGDVSLAETAASMSPLTPPKKAENLPAGPGAVATTDELSRAWSSKRFLFRDALTSQMAPAIVVRLPGGEYWGFSLREPFGNCELQFMTDLKTLKAGYNLKADHPMVVDPCNRTVYDLLRYGGGASDNGLVRGEIVQGSGIRPPMAIEIMVKGKNVIATRME
jgi:hypothetical protein